MPIVTLTATTPGPCACCGVGGAVMSCRTRGGTATLIGCPEFGTPSVPPRSYRRTDGSGSHTSSLFSDGGCTAPIGGSSVTCVATYWLQYDAVTGAITTGGNNTCNGVPGPGITACAPPPANICWETYTPISQTVWISVPTVNCCNMGDGTWRKNGGTDHLTITLSDEDTETDAISRLLAGAGGTWSAYTQVGDGTGATCLATSCCLAQYAQRTTGFTFAYGEAQFKAVMTLLDPTTAYVATFQVYRRLQGSSDPWVLLLESAFGFTTDGSGNYTITDQDVPNLEGYETYVCCPFIYKP